MSSFSSDSSTFPKQKKNNKEIYSSNKELLIQIKQAFKIEYPVRKTKDQVVDDLTGQIMHRTAHRISLGAELFEEMISSYGGSMERKRPPRFCNKK